MKDKREEMLGETYMYDGRLVDVMYLDGGDDSIVLCADEESGFSVFPVKVDDLKKI